MSDNSDNSEYESDDDEDYIPEISGSEEEEEFGKKKTKRKRKTIRNKPVRSSKRKRRGRIELDYDEEEDEDVPLDDDESEEDVASEEEQEGDEEEGDEEEEEQEKEEKSRVDDLWEEFKKDTAGLTSSKKGITSDDNKEVKKPCSDQTEGSSKEMPKKVEITEVYDFAGEEVKVVKSVDASSIQASSKNNTEISTTEETKPKPNPSVIKKKPSGLGSVLGKLGKKTKLSTLEKSKLDWSQFKKQEGIEDELKTSNKDGYLEKTAFLSRVDQKQFEIERDIRQGVRKR